MTVTSFAIVVLCRDRRPVVLATDMVVESVEKAPLASSRSASAAAITARAPSARRSGSASAVAGT
jgi:hypothetical protein